MKGVSKVNPPSKYVLKDIYLSYFYGAKIGVLGLNGAGKSSLLRIMAGEDDEFLGESFPAKDYRLGFLKQEPELNEEATVKENIMEGLGALNDWLKEFNELSEKMCDENITPEEMEKLIDRQGTIQEKIEAVVPRDLNFPFDPA